MPEIKLTQDYRHDDDARTLYRKGARDVPADVAKAAKAAGIVADDSKAASKPADK